MADAGKKEAKDTAMKTVQLDGQVLLKITQHCKDALPQLATGQLLGLDVGQTLEVTDCFPFPVRGAAAAYQAAQYDALPLCGSCKVV